MTSTSNSADKLSGEQTSFHEWDASGWTPEKRSVFDYGYVTRGQTIGCTREELIRAAGWRGASQISLAWTPETPQPVPPEKIPLLLEAFRRVAIKEARKNIFWGVGLIAFGIILALVVGDWKYLYLNILSVFGALALIEGVWGLWSRRDYKQENAEADVSSQRFDAWINSRHISGYTFMLCACIVVVGAAQLFSGDVDSIQRAGLVKPAVWSGQWWRLFTACLMHVSFMHFWMNFLVLLHFARIVEGLIHRAYVPLLFLISGACGSLFSLVLYPHTTSVGASGGIMGLLGFVTVAAYTDGKKFPPKYLRRSIEAIVFIAVFGLIGFAFIDNAAHLGGLCAGLAIAWVFRPDKEKGGSRRAIANISVISILALIVLGVISGVAVMKIVAFF
jgi:membrane associated rhomboid family serine protease